MAQAFNIAYEKWQAHKKKKEEKKAKQKMERAKPVESSEHHTMESISLGMHLCVCG